MATKRVPRAPILVSTPELAIIFRGESVSGHPGARSAPKKSNIFKTKIQNFQVEYNLCENYYVHQQRVLEALHVDEVQDILHVAEQLAALLVFVAPVGRLRSSARCQQGGCGRDRRQLVEVP